VSNKPVLPTATTSRNNYAPGPLRRQTGQPLGSLEEKRVGQRPSKSKTWATSREQRASSGKDNGVTTSRRPNEATSDDPTSTVTYYSQFSEAPDATDQ
jgi:hypothetical protein